MRRNQVGVSRGESITCERHATLRIAQFHQVKVLERRLVVPYITVVLLHGGNETLRDEEIPFSSVGRECRAEPDA